jgi:hypothetical protein
VRAGVQPAVRVADALHVAPCVIGVLRPLLTCIISFISSSRTPL